ncbi:MAG: hypothetical protein NVS3B5_09870 [Sphingomicrobium sp.]
MTTTHKPRSMARDPNPQSGEGARTDGGAGGMSATDLADVPEPKPARMTKRNLLIDLLSREGGASLAVIVEATGWLPHTTRAALTGLRKKGHAIERFRCDEETRYRIATASAEALVDEAYSAGDADGTGPGAGSDADAGVDGGVTV